MALDAPLHTLGVLTFSDGTKAVGKLRTPYGADVRFDFGDAEASLFVTVLAEDHEAGTPEPFHLVSWAPMPTERHDLASCPVEALGVVERRDGTFHVGTVSCTRTRAFTEFTNGWNRLAFSFPINGNSLSDDAPIAWYPLPDA
jgi:hypothetical protein